MSDYCRTCDRNNPDENVELLARVRELEAALRAANERYELMVAEARKVNRAWKIASDERDAALAASAEERGDERYAPDHPTRGTNRAPDWMLERALRANRNAAAGGAEGDTP